MTTASQAKEIIYLLNRIDWSEQGHMSEVLELWEDAVYQQIIKYKKQFLC